MLRFEGIFASSSSTYGRAWPCLFSCPFGRAQVNELRARAESSDPAAGEEERGLHAWLATGGAGGREGLTDTDLLRFIMFRSGWETFLFAGVGRGVSAAGGREARERKTVRTVRSRKVLSGWDGGRDQNGCRGCQRRFHASFRQCIPKDIHELAIAVPLFVSRRAPSYFPAPPCPPPFFADAPQIKHRHGDADAAWLQVRDLCVWT